MNTQTFQLNYFNPVTVSILKALLHLEDLEVLFPFLTPRGGHVVVTWVRLRTFVLRKVGGSSLGLRHRFVS